MDNLKDALLIIGSSITTITVILGVGRYFGQKEKIIETLELRESKERNEHVAQIDLHCPNQHMTCPYKDDFIEFRKSLTEVCENVAELSGKVDGVKSTVEFIGGFLRNARISDTRDG